MALGPTIAEARGQERKVEEAAPTPDVVKMQMNRSGAEGTTRRGQIEREEGARTGALEDRTVPGPRQAPPQRAEERQERK
ncbi:MAG: hypothetical protein ACRERD_20360 [Candidatus Binatia bacterium]